MKRGAPIPPDGYEWLTPAERRFALLVIVAGGVPWVCFVLWLLFWPAPPP